MVVDPRPLGGGCRRRGVWLGSSSATPKTSTPPRPSCSPTSGRTRRSPRSTTSPARTPGWSAKRAGDLAACRSSGTGALVSFGEGLRQDYAPVRAALAEPWSSGQAEGQINRLKMLKRQMYGRAGFDLLRKRVVSKQIRTAPRGPDGRRAWRPLPPLGTNGVPVTTPSTATRTGCGSACPPSPTSRRSQPPLSRRATQPRLPQGQDTSRICWGPEGHRPGRFGRASEPSAP